MKTLPLRLSALCVATVLIGWGDYLTGDELDLFVVYFLPIGYAAWKVGPRAGVALAVLSAGLWGMANLEFGHAYSQTLLGVWGEVAFLGTFVAVALAVSRIRGLLDHERQLNRKLAEALAKVKRLSGRLPICVGCKSVQDERGGWHEIEEYFTTQSEDDFIFKHGVCPHCVEAGTGKGAGVAAAAGGRLKGGAGLL